MTPSLTHSENAFVLIVKKIVFLVKYFNGLIILFKLVPSEALQPAVLRFKLKADCSVERTLPLFRVLDHLTNIEER